MKKPLLVIIAAVLAVWVVVMGRLKLRAAENEAALWHEATDGLDEQPADTSR